MEAFWVLYAVISVLFAGTATAAAHQQQSEQTYRRAKRWHKAYSFNAVDLEGNNQFPNQPYGNPTGTNIEEHHLFKQVYPRSQTPRADAIPLTWESIEKPAVQPVATTDPQPVATTPVETFWLWVSPYVPLTLDVTDTTTREAVKQAVMLGVSQNQMCNQLFGLNSKGSKSYNQAVAIIKDVQHEVGHE